MKLVEKTSFLRRQTYPILVFVMIYKNTKRVYSYSHIKNIMSDDKSDDIDASFSCVDCGQEFESLKELEEHETKLKN
jgi:hypothetical protein